MPEFAHNVSIPLFAMFGQYIRQQAFMPNAEISINNHVEFFFRAITINLRRTFRAISTNPTTFERYATLHRIFVPFKIKDLV